MEISGSKGSPNKDNVNISCDPEDKKAWKLSATYIAGFYEIFKGKIDLWVASVLHSELGLYFLYNLLQIKVLYSSAS